jgi:hypothetical protein
MCKGTGYQAVKNSPVNSGKWSRPWTAERLTRHSWSKMLRIANQILAGAYCTREQYAHALLCNPRDLGKKIASLNIQRHKPELMDTEPCKEVILKGDDVDLTRFPLFLYHFIQRPCFYPRFLNLLQHTRPRFKLNLYPLRPFSPRSILEQQQPPFPGTLERPGGVLRAHGPCPHQ